MNKPGLATYSTFCDDGHMSDSSFPRTRKGAAAGASPRLAAADAILQRLRGKKKTFPSFPLLPREPVVTGRFVCGVGGYPGRRLPGWSWSKRPF